MPTGDWACPGRSLNDGVGPGRFGAKIGGCAVPGLGPFDRSVRRRSVPKPGIARCQAEVVTTE